MRIVVSLVALLLTAALSRADSYSDAYKNSVRDKIPMVVYVGCEAKFIPSVWYCRVEKLEGYPAPCVVVSIPQAEVMLHSKTYSPNDKVTLPTHASSFTYEVEALHEVNQARASRGLRPFQHDPLLTLAARAAANFRAAMGIAGHTQNDFGFIPSGGSASAAGCAAWSLEWGWGSCCTYDSYTYAGAAWAMGRDGRRYMHLFVR